MTNGRAHRIVMRLAAFDPISDIPKNKASNESSDNHGGKQSIPATVRRSITVAEVAERAHHDRVGRTPEERLARGRIKSWPRSAKSLLPSLLSLGSLSWDLPQASARLGFALAVPI
jgi:hypothetical protein